MLWPPLWIRFLIEFLSEQSPPKDPKMRSDCTRASLVREIEAEEAEESADEVP